MKLLELRERRNFSRELLAHRLGVTTKDVEQWETSGKIPLEQINPICQQFRCHPARLLGLRDN